MLVLCSVFLFLSLVVNGNLLRLYSLHREQDRLLEQIRLTKNQMIELDQQIQRSKDPLFMERQALDHYDFADDKDLIFVFAEK